MPSHPLRGDKISERSLELNVLSEAIEYLRNTISKAYIVGYTARQEHLHGLDVSINAPGMIISAFQFKAPKGKNNIYRFTIADRCWICSNPKLGSRRQPLREISKILNQYNLRVQCINQHTILYVTSILFEYMLNNAHVYYAFPLIRSYTELEQRIPRTIDFTILIRVKDMPLSTFLDCKSHKVEITIKNNNFKNISVVIRSEPIHIPSEGYITLRDLLKEKEKILEKEKISLPETTGAIHLNPDEFKLLLEKEFIGRAEKEKIDPELIDRARRLAEVLPKISFSYRGIALSIK